MLMGDPSITRAELGHPCHLSGHRAFISDGSLQGGKCQTCGTALRLTSSVQFGDFTLVPACWPLGRPASPESPKWPLIGVWRPAGATPEEYPVAAHTQTPWL